MSSSRLSALLDGILEAGWLAAIIVTPLLFNIYSSRVFEPDKLTTLRSIALAMSAVWLLRWFEERGNEQERRITWRTPLILPTLFTVLVYLVSNLFSLTPAISFFGSYQRLQGTFTTLSYIVVFLIILDRMRTRAQVDRFITTLILNSLPIALYGFVQHSSRDPLPWGGDVTQRVASNMGNPIFVAAYMIMIAPPTLSRIVGSFRAILTEEETGAADVLRAAAYIFIFLVQVISIWYTESRGPLAGLLGGLGLWAFLGLLTLQQSACKKSSFKPGELLADLGRGAAFVLGGLAASGAVAGLAYFIARGLVMPGSEMPQWVAVLGGGLVFAGSWLGFIVNGQGWRWLWISALLIAVLFSAGFLTINLVEPVHAWSQEQPWLGRLDDVLQVESGTGKVRSLIWEGAVDLILPHEPIVYPATTEQPEERPDRFNALRPLIGYGPESMYVAYNRFYPPVLGHYESRTASPDRSHNETLDALVITGAAGFAAYIWLFASLFTLGLRWLGLLPDGWRRTLFWILLGLGAAATVAAVIPTVGAHFFGLAIPVGMVGGLFLYLVIYGFSVYWQKESTPSTSPHFALLIGILSAFVAHLIEINFGIAIAATRTTFWALAGVFILLGQQKIAEGEEIAAAEQAQQNERAKRRRRRRAPERRSIPAWLWPSLGAALIGALMLGTLAYDFVNNVERLTEPLQIFWRSLTVIAHGAPRSSWGIMMVFGVTWAAIGLLTISEMVKRKAFSERQSDVWAALLVVMVVALAVGALFGLSLAGRHARIANTQVQTIAEAIRLADYVAGQMTAYYLFLAAMLVLGGLALMGERPIPARWGSEFSAAIGLVLLVLVPIAAYRLNLRPIHADIVYKQADPWDQSGQWQVSVEYYQHAIDLVPREDFYHLYLGRAYLEYATALPDASQQDLVMRNTEQVLLQAQALNPLNTDHSANLARMYSRWSGLPAGQQNSQTLAELSSHYYAVATKLSPNNAILWNEWARLYHWVLRDEEGFQQTIDRSLEVDPEFDQTWLLVGDVRAESGDLEGAAEAYRAALELKPDQPVVWSALGRIYLQLGRNEDAIEAFSRALEQAPAAGEAWDWHRLLAAAYYQAGFPEQAMAEAQLALQTAPEEQQALVMQLLEQMQGQPLQQGVTP